MRSVSMTLRRQRRRRSGHRARRSLDVAAHANRLPCARKQSARVAPWSTHWTTRFLLIFSPRRIRSRHAELAANSVWVSILNAAWSGRYSFAVRCPSPASRLITGCNFANPVAEECPAPERIPSRRFNSSGNDNDSTRSHRRTVALARRGRWTPESGHFAGDIFFLSSS